MIAPKPGQTDVATWCERREEYVVALTRTVPYRGRQLERVEGCVDIDGVLRRSCHGPHVDVVLTAKVRK